MTPSCSLLIATYNWTKALALVLDSVKLQKVLPNEVLIADDGSEKATADVIQKYQKEFPVPLIHIWHEDLGFRLSEIRNKAIAQAKMDYIIQIDGDVILHPMFVADHLKFSEKGFFIIGSRVLLEKSLSLKIFQKGFKRPFYFSSNIKNRLNSLRLTSLSELTKKYKKNPNKLRSGLRGCNMSFWKKDLVHVNGYNNDMTGWGREDSEICVRLFNSGVYGKKIKFAALQYHLYHKENSRVDFNVNDDILQNTIDKKTISCENGIFKKKKSIP
ncbi:MAG: glycosyltransferase family 2 protein [Flavobacteriaceae bacterium]|nr:glycosyltransferase family 2 protein [Flavobacteriaceae bacterium]